MADRKTTPKYSEDFKKTIVSLYQSGKTYSEIQKECTSPVKTDNGKRSPSMVE